MVLRNCTPASWWAGDLDPMQDEIAEASTLIEKYALGRAYSN
jgi:hypothetical protein